MHLGDISRTHQTEGVEMTVHTTFAGLGREVIGEFLIAARMCVDYKKLDGGILGYPATFSCSPSSMRLVTNEMWDRGIRG
jgi:hypothetical protein